MAQKINDNYQRNATVVEKQLVASPAKVFTNRTCTSTTLSIATTTDNKLTINQEKLHKKLGNIEDEYFWEIIAGYNVPYIIRLVNGEHLKFVATRMAEYELLKKYLQSIHSKMYTSCTPVKAYVITDSEVKILNYINEKHYGYKKQFQFKSGMDFIVRLEDIHNLYLFMDVCYKKLLCNGTSGYKEKCGFICVNSNPNCCIPYCTQDGRKYVPLFYFEIITEDLTRRAVKLEDWNLAYLKFCCRLHGINDKFFIGNSCLVVSFHYLKASYSPETKFKDCWPTKLARLYLLNNKKSYKPNPPGSWFKTAPGVVLDQNTIPHTLTVSAPVVPHSKQVMMSQMQPQQIITTPQIQANETSNNVVYMIQMRTLEGKTIHCINSKPYMHSDLMVTIKELVSMVVPFCNVAKCAHVLLTCLEKKILFGKPEQLAVLLENGLIRSIHPADTPMAILKDVIQVLPQLKTLVLMQDKEIEQYRQTNRSKVKL